MDFSVFFDGVRDSLFKGSLSQSQVDGLNVILDKMSAFQDTILRNQAAYILATAYHETGATLQPVRETFAKSDAQAIARLDTAFAKGKLKGVSKPYWRTGWFGRGYVQLTHKTNYKKMEKILGIPLVDNPGLALQPDTAAAILIEGMMKGASNRGDFTAHKLEDFVHLKKSNYVSARKVVNGTDRAALIAGHAKKFEAALKEAGFDTAAELTGKTPAKKPKGTSAKKLQEIEAKIAELETLLDALRG